MTSFTKIVPVMFVVDSVEFVRTGDQTGEKIKAVLLRNERNTIREIKMFRENGEYYRHYNNATSVRYQNECWKRLKEIVEFSK